MKIGIDVSPLHSGHAIRGIGFYVKHLKESLLTYNKENDYEFLQTVNTHLSLDILHVPYFDPFFTHLPIRKNYKLIVTVHDLTPMIFPDLFPIGIKGRLKWEFNKWLLRNADAIITDSNSSKKDIHKLTGIAKDRIHTVYLAAGDEFKFLNLSESEKNKFRKKYNLPDTFLLYVGDVTPNKNLSVLVDAIKKTNYPLVFVGKALANKNYDADNEWNKDLVYVQEKIKDDPQYTILGFVDQDDLVGIYNIATSSIVPSLYEGFGLPVLEAMQSGCPVITTKNGSLPEVAGDAAFYVDASNVSTLADGIIEVLENNTLKRELIEKGFKQAQKFTWEQTAVQTQAVYKQTFSLK